MKESTKKLIQESAKSEIVNQFKYGITDHSDWNGFLIFGEPKDNADISFESERPGLYQEEWDNLSEEEQWNAEDARDEFIENAIRQIDEADEQKLKKIAESVCPTYVHHFLINEGVIRHKPVL